LPEAKEKPRPRWMIGWVHSDIRSAASIIVSIPRWQWYLPWKLPTYLYLKGVIKECYYFLVGIDDLESPEVDWEGNKFWFGEGGRIVRYELAEKKDKVS